MSSINSFGAQLKNNFPFLISLMTGRWRFAVWFVAGGHAGGARARGGFKEPGFVSFLLRRCRGDRWMGWAWADGRMARAHHPDFCERIKRPPAARQHQMRFPIAASIALLVASSPSSVLGFSKMASPSTVAEPARDAGLFIETPMVPSTELTKLCNRPVYLKLDTLQASGSFKDRGMAHLCETFKSEKGTKKLISSSGGNAGLACATVGPKLGMDVSVIVPESTKPIVVNKLKSLGADVTIHGKNWNAADELARKRVEEDAEAEYVSPYDHELLWTGHSTVVDEIVQQLPGVGNTPAMIIASVGGGGLICGILEGLDRHGMASAVVAAETEGAASFGKSFVSGKKIRLDSIDSIATSLGALEVTDVALDRARAHQEKGGTVKAAMCTDAEAVEACVRFAEECRILVEPACGAALAALYSDRLRKDVLGGLGEGPIVVEVCGGSGVNTDLLSLWKKEFLDK